MEHLVLLFLLATGPKGQIQDYAAPRDYKSVAACVKDAQEILANKDAIHPLPGDTVTAFCVDLSTMQRVGYVTNPPELKAQP